MKKIKESATMASNKKIFEETVSSVEEISKSKVKSFLIEPLKMGLVSFAILFSIILFVKLVNFLSAENSQFTLTIYDVIISIIGFLFGFIVELSLQVRKRTNGTEQ